MRQSDHSRLWHCPALVFLVGLLLGTVVPAMEADASAPELQISVIGEPKSQEFGWVYVTGMDRDALVQLRESQPDVHQWRRMFSVRLRPPQSPTLESEELPNVVGQYQVLETGLRFVPRFAPRPGLFYHVAVSIDGYKPTAGVFVLNDTAPPVDVKTKVDTVYPSARSIPENTLRLYVHFSKPMRRGQVTEKLRLLDENNKVIQDAFIVGPLGELWDRDQRRLTLLLDPGRIKRGVAPNRNLGPALKAGGRRTLSIDGQFTDAEGHPIESEVRKTYEIDEAIREAVSPNRWVIAAPASGTRASLRIRFDRALDSGMLSHAIGIYDLTGARVEGRTGFGAGETEWSFTPTEPWADSGHIIRVASSLEDVSGNNILAPMDVTVTPSLPLTSREAGRKHTEIQFTPNKQIN